MEPGLVSVIIPNYNYARYLGAALDSALGQSYRPVEVIVVDDGSTDQSRDVLSSYGDRITPVFQRNQGVAASRNNGVEASRGEFIAFLDADDSWLPGKIEQEVAEFRSDATLGLVHVGIREVDGGGNILRERLEGGSGRISLELLMMTSNGILGGGSGFMVPRVVFDEIGGFDTRLSTSADFDFFLRVTDRYPVAFVNEVLINYRVHGSNMHSNIKVMERDMTLAFEKEFNGESSPRSRACYGNLYKNLSGSYFRSGDYRAFLRTAAISLKYKPANILYFVQFPLRRMKNHR